LLALDGLVTAISFALNTEAAIRETFVVADRDPIALREIVAALRAANGRPRRLVAVPVPLLRPVLRLARAWDRVGGELVVDVAKLTAAGWQPVADTGARLRQTASVV
jgi:UDP-glucose 4-epimerase